MEERVIDRECTNCSWYMEERVIDRERTTVVGTWRRE